MPRAWANTSWEESPIGRTSIRIVGQVRGRGLMIGIELVKSQETREPHPEARNRVIERAFELGLLVLGCGESTIRLMPPLVIDREQADCAIDMLDRCIAEVEH